MANDQRYRGNLNPTLNPASALPLGADLPIRVPVEVMHHELSDRVAYAVIFDDTKRKTNYPTLSL